MPLRQRPIPTSLHRILDAFRPCFTTPTFLTFTTLVAGMIARPTSRTICGMWTGARLAGVAHHARAHGFFSAAAWRPEQVGLVLLRLVVGHLVPAHAPVTLAVDDTMFRRTGKKVDGAHWGYDGSLKVPKGGKRLSRGHCFVIAAVIVKLPFLDRPIALPVLATCGARAARPKSRSPAI